MRLHDFMVEEGLTSGTLRRYGLEDVVSFSFGKHYTIHLIEGRSIVFTDLAMILEIMHEEFAIDTEFLAVSKFDSIIRNKVGIPRSIERVLIVEPTTRQWVSPTGPLPGTNVIAASEVAAKVRHAVTVYNLTGGWEAFPKDNL